jgi:hypothetical protein
VIFSLGLTWPSYTHNVPNLSPQVFSQMGTSKFFPFFFSKDWKVIIRSSTQTLDTYLDLLPLYKYP